MKKLPTTLIALVLAGTMGGAVLLFQQTGTAVAAPASAPADKSWLTDYPAALAKAKAEGKLVLLDFTGSDWCEGCILLAREVFATTQFKDYANKHFVLVEVDFPLSKEVPEKLQKQNLALKSKYLSEDAFPTLVVITPEEKRLGQVLGYRPALGPKGVISDLDAIVKKAR